MSQANTTKSISKGNFYFPKYNISVSQSIVGTIGKKILISIPRIFRCENSRKPILIIRKTDSGTFVSAHIHLLPIKNLSLYISLKWKMGSRKIQSVSGRTLELYGFALFYISIGRVCSGQSQIDECFNVLVWLILLHLSKKISWKVYLMKIFYLFISEDIISFSKTFG